MSERPFNDPVGEQNDASQPIKDEPITENIQASNGGEDEFGAPAEAPLATKEQASAGDASAVTESQTPTEEQHTADATEILAAMGTSAVSEAPETQTAQLPKADTAEEPYLYRWSYEDQTAFDNKQVKKKKKSGAWVYAIVMSAAFLLCLGFLGVVIYVNQQYLKEMEQNQPMREILTTGEVAELVNPSTVLVYASNSTEGGYGTGFFVRSDGYILTNCHVVNGKNNITVTLYDGREYTPELKWYSEADDLALLKISGENHPAVRIGNSDALAIGDTAIAIGNPAGNICPWTTTQGIISSPVRQISVESSTAIIDMTVIQTDAQVNPGNSGGPLCNDRGEVIGIVVRKLTNYESLGFAIPINGAMKLVNAYLETGSTAHIRSEISRVRPTIGIQAVSVKKGDPVTPVYEAPVDGVLIVSLTEGGPAVGILQVYDIISGIDGTPVEDMEELRALLYRYNAGDSVTLAINRKGTSMTVTLKLGVASAG